MLTYPYTSIKLGNRLRKTYEGIDDLATSIETNGLIQPIVINSVGDLIAGGRRYAAVGKLGWTDIPVVMIETLDEAHLRRLEVAENLDRQELTWQEIAVGIDTYHDLRTKQNNGQWIQSQTASELGFTQAYVSYSIKLANEIRRGNKAVIESAGISDAIKVIAKSAEDLIHIELAKRTLPPTPTTPNPQGQPNNNDLFAGLVSTQSILVPLSQMFHRGDAITFLDGRLEGSIDHIITDPPYAIDMDMLDQSNQGIDNISRILDTHDVVDNLKLFKTFIPAAHRVVKDGGFCIMWCDIHNWQYIYDLATLVGFKVQRWPFIWCKSSSCKNSAAQYNLTKNFETAMFMRKGKAILPKPIPSSWYIGTNDADRSTHPFVKPSHVWHQLIEAVSLQGETICDPFAGEGSCPLQALRSNRKVLANEIAENHWAKMLDKAKQHYQATFKEVRFE